jgi:hypothetical protein
MMVNLRRYILMLFFAGLTVSAISQKTQYVVIAVIDGARYTETLGDTSHSNIPGIWNQLRPEATIYSSCYNNGSTTTCAGHANIVTGTWQPIANTGTERPHMPTIFEYLRKFSGSPMDENYVVLGKTKLNILAYSDHPSYDSLYGASVDQSVSEYNDSLTLAGMENMIRDHHPKLMIANFANVDLMWHSGIYIKYITAIMQVDSLICQLWNYIQADSTYSDRTTLIVTNDHGRHTNDFSSHGDACEGCRHVMMMILGPDTPDNIIDGSYVEQIDIAPTIGDLLGFPTPYCTGKPLRSAFYDIPLFDTVHVFVNDTIYHQVNDTVHIAVTDTLIIDVTFTGINSAVGHNSFKVYPNPSMDRIRIETGDYLSMAGCSLQITNSGGQLIFSTPIADPFYELDLMSWGGPGDYILKIFDTSNHVITTKVIVLK